MKFFNSATLLLLCVFIFAVSSIAQKITPEEIVAKHLDSIGSKEKRAEIKNQIAFGDVQFKLQGSATVLGGKIVLVSSGEKNLWGMNLTSNDYPLDRFSFDGKEAKVGFVRPGVRSILGAFIYSYNELLREGLPGGTLLSSWTLLNTDAKNLKMSYEGTKKIDGKETFVLSYSPRNSSDLSIKMYFDKENYRHVRTEYNRVVGAAGGNIAGGSIAQSESRVNNTAGQGEDRYRLVEDFSDFKKAGGLTLPSAYKISYSYTNNGTIQTAQKPNREAEWKFTITNFSYNQQLDANSFDIDAK